ncbi:hypothetical protein GCM10009114_04290 [Aliiglaciecola litoralis]|uniref:PEP-CTERM protein-sorting domain-containing protein n=2 Tax=Aliiglaciecola litoralis TaxID=582857 RepID=A0ABP3WMD8_9ALTE
MNTAQATLIFDFELRDDTYFLYGSIHGLVDNLANQQAMHVFNGGVTDYAIDTYPIRQGDSFTESLAFFKDRPNYDGQWASASSYWPIYFADSDGDAEIILRVGVLEPHTALLVILALAGLGVSRYKKQL